MTSRSVRCIGLAALILVLIPVPALAAGGSTLRDYADLYGRRGGMQAQWRVYGRRGGPCPRCQTALRYEKVGQRGTTWCPGCQR